LGDIFTNLARDVSSWKSLRCVGHHDRIEADDGWEDDHDNHNELLVVGFIEEAISMAITFM
jgi:hypothetical protein